MAGAVDLKGGWTLRGVVARKSEKTYERGKGYYATVQILGGEFLVSVSVDVYGRLVVGQVVDLAGELLAAGGGVKLRATSVRPAA